MPIYEFYCPKCNTLFNFFSSSINTEKIPSCPRCGKTRLERRLSLFSLSRGREEEVLPDIDESKMEKAMDLLSKESENIDQNDPRQAVNLMRKFADVTGISMGSGMEEALTRMEAGEDPEKVEEEMGDMLESEDPFIFKKRELKEKKQRPPKVDEKLYDL